MNVVPTPVSFSESPRTGEFFLKLFEGYLQFTEDAAYRAGVLIVPRFSNGDLLAIRCVKEQRGGLSLELPFARLSTLSSVRASSLDKAAVSPAMRWDYRSIYRLGELDAFEPSARPQVFLAAIPDDACLPGTSLEAVDTPLRLTTAQFHERITQGEVTDILTLAALSLFASHQASIKTAVVLPLIDRRKKREAHLPGGQ